MELELEWLGVSVLQRDLIFGKVLDAEDWCEEEEDDDDEASKRPS